jgi:prepilin-type N-terminal cleavage/methylation domain-containing protein
MALHSLQRCRRRTGFTLVELIVVMTVVAILSTIAVPSFRRTLERAKTDYAGANLESIWKAQQLFWLDTRTYATSLEQLAASGLIDPGLLATQSDFTYTIQSASADTFSVLATRRGSRDWTGSLVLDQTGLVTGSIKSLGLPSIVPTLR